jgi:hypothetical protein
MTYDLHIKNLNTYICSLTVLAQTSYERGGVNLMLWKLT